MLWLLKFKIEFQNFNFKRVEDSVSVHKAKV